MLRRLRHLENWDVRSRDGQDLGKIEDFYFDDERWTVRYVVVRAGNWFVGKSVLLSPMAVDRVEWDKGAIAFALTGDQIKNAPDADLTRPLSRRWEATYSGYYGFPFYWAGPGVWGVGPTPLDVRSQATHPAAPPPAAEEEHLRSAREVEGYHIHAQDGEIGHVEDFLVDDQSWTIRYLLVDTSNWIGGRTVLIAPEFATRIEWAGQQVHVDVSREDVKSSPEYDPGAEIDRAYEERVAQVYRRPVRRT
jgi:sporulation protein YlmC with PRC-barrel domain